MKEYTTVQDDQNNRAEVMKETGKSASEAENDGSDKNEEEEEEDGPITLQGILESSTFKVCIVILIYVAIFCGGSLIIFYVYRSLASEEFTRCRARPPFSNPILDNSELNEQPQSSVVMLRNAKNMQLGTVDVHIVDGKIKQVGRSLPKPSDVASFVELDAQGRFVTAGLVDMHSHLGVHSLPSLKGSLDVNEKTNPATPFVRVVDALNPEDSAISQILSGGVTTSLVLPGSSNVIGGEGVIVKNTGKSVNSMLVQGAPRVIKMACGENPTRVYGTKGKLPSSRMGNAWVLRKKMEQAQSLVNRQDSWDCDPANRLKSLASRPSSNELDLLVGVLRGENVSVNVHCYQVQDMESVIRVSKEFGFRINAFHHSSEAYKLLDLIHSQNITVSIFPDLFGSKLEQSGGSVKAPKILSDAGIPVAIKSDHPVIHARSLIHHAARAAFYGLSEDKALQAVTTVPAASLGLGNRIGSIDAGYDADIVVWDRHPLMLGATPDIVLVNGQVAVQRNTLKRSQQEPVVNSNPLQIAGTCNVGTASTSYAVVANQIYTMIDLAPIQNGRVIVQDGIIICVGPSCTIPFGANVYTQQGGILLPGFVESSSQLGLVDILQEPETNDGPLSSPGMIATGVPVYSKDGIRMQNKPMLAAWRGGVTTSISHLANSATVVAGVSSALFTRGTLVSESLIQNATCLHINLGNSAKADASVSGEIAQLRNLFKSAMNSSKPNDPFVLALQHKLPVAVMCHSADLIAQALILQSEFNFTMIIIGGAEAYLQADRLSAQRVSVVLTPSFRTDIETWEARRKKSDFGISDLLSAGVKVAIGTGYKSPYVVRDLRWIAGMLSTAGAAGSTVSESTSLAMITRIPADMFGLSDAGVGVIKVGTRANLALFDGNPLTFEGRLKLVSVGSAVECNPEQE